MSKQGEKSQKQALTEWDLIVQVSKQFAAKTIVMKTEQTTQRKT
jgi:hypothetical protein